MGNKSSTNMVVENDTVIRDKSSLENENKQYSNLITKNIMSKAASCSSEAGVNQEINISDIEAEEDINIGGIKQNAKVMVNFSCVQGSDIKDTTSSQMLMDVMNDLTSSTNTALNDKIAATAESKASSGVGSMLLTAPTSSASNTLIRNKYDILTEKNKKIVNVVSNTIDKTFESKSIDDCISKVSAQQKQNFKNLKSKKGGITIQDLSQEAVIDSLGKCIQDNKIAQDVTTAVSAELGIKVEDKTETSKTSETDAKGSSDTKAKGLEDVVASVFSGISGIFTGLFGTFLIVPIIISVLCCLCCVSLIAYFMFSGNKSNSVQSEQSFGDNEEMVGGLLSSTLNFFTSD
jgi:hypothetical protein